MTKTKGFDLAALNPKKASDEGYELELRHPVERTPLGVFITVAGSESDTFRNHVRQKGNERLRKRFEDQRKGRDGETPTIEGAEEDTIALLAACTLSWRTGDEPTITHDGKALECNANNAAFLYRELRWAREQVDEAIGDLGNFIGK